jgi:CheY-like chemotaxis protein
MIKPRILVIDDNTDHLEILTIELGKRYEVFTAADGLDGYALAVNGHIAVIVLDITMPLVDGWTVLNKLRTNPITRHIPVIILTALELEAVQSGAHRLGVFSIMRKPTDLKGVGQEIARLIGLPK